MSAQSKRDSVVPAERALAQRLRDGEAALARACVARGSAWTVLRPTLVYGAGLDKSLTPIARRALRTRVFPLPAGRGLRQPIGEGLQRAEADQRRQRRPRRHGIGQRAAPPGDPCLRRTRTAAQRQYGFAAGHQARQQEMADLAAGAANQYRHARLSTRPGVR
jgi:hypothetical protein